MPTRYEPIATMDAGPHRTASDTQSIYVDVTSAIGQAIHRALSARLSGARVRALPDAAESGTAARDEMRGGDLLVAAIDHGVLAHLDPHLTGHRARVLCVHVHGSQAVIGPDMAPDRAGCLQCWSTRYFAGKQQARGWLLGETAHARAAAAPALTSPWLTSPWLTPLSIAMIAEITAARAVQLMTHDLTRDLTHDSGRATDGAGDEPWAVYSLNLRTLTGASTRLLPDPLCPRCGHRPLDTSAAAQIHLQPRPKPHPDDDRLRRASELTDRLNETYVGNHAGLVSDVQLLSRITNIAVATTYVPLTDYTGVSRKVPCSGFSDRYSASRPVAILEGLERYASTRPRQHRFAVHDCLDALGSVAEDPRQFGWYGEEAYDENRQWLTRFDGRLAVDFVWAYSFRRRQPVLLPAQLAYYMEPSNGDRTYVIDSSVGCALASSPEEAIYHGLLEVIERDAFLLAWYARRAMRRFDVMDCPDLEVRAHHRRLRAEGYDIAALDATTDFGVPAVIVIARHRDAVIPYSSGISAAHPRPDHALRKAFRELVPGLRRYGAEVREERLDYTYGLLEDDRRVRAMEDHAYLYCLPETGPALDFLTTVTEETTLQALRDRGRPFCGADLTDEMQSIVRHVLTAADDVYAIDQTAPELRGAGLYCFKVMVPGALPMTWGQHLRRLERLPRLDRALAASGQSTPNPAPHAFP
jgi:ribosomal protein S12 methylthiotransferase accessory factor